MCYLHDIIDMALLQSSLVLKHKNNQVMSQTKFLHEGLFLQQLIQKMQLQIYAKSQQENLS